MSQPEIQVLNDFMSWFVIQQTIMADDPLQCKDILEYLGKVYVNLSTVLQKTLDYKSRLYIVSSNVIQK